MKVPRRVGFAMWLLTCLAVLAYGISGYYRVASSERPEIDIVVGIAMTLLTFPLGLVVTVLIGELGRVAYESSGLVLRSGYLALVAVWATYLVVGAIQWLLVWPAVARRIRSRHHAAPPSIR